MSTSHDGSVTLADLERYEPHVSRRTPPLKNKLKITLPLVVAVLLSTDITQKEELEDYE